MGTLNSELKANLQIFLLVHVGQVLETHCVHLQGLGVVYQLDVHKVLQHSLKPNRERVGGLCKSYRHVGETSSRWPVWWVHESRLRFTWATLVSSSATRVHAHFYNIVQAGECLKTLSAKKNQNKFSYFSKNLSIWVKGYKSGSEKISEITQRRFLTIGNYHRIMQIYSND